MSEENRSLDIGVLKGALDDGDVFNVSFDDNSDVSETPPPAAPSAPSAQQITNKADIDTTDTAESDDLAPAPAANNTTDLLKVFATNLAEKGLLNFTEEELTKTEDPDKFFEDKINETISKRVEDAIKAKESEWPEEVSKLVELSKQGVPLHAILEADARISSLEGIAPTEVESNTELQKDILREVYSAQGFSADKIEAKVKRAEDLGSLKEDAIDGFDVLIAREKQAKIDLIKSEQAKAKDAETKRAARLSQIETDIKNAKEIIPGIPLTEDEKKILINGITKASATDKDGKPINALAKARIDDPLMDYKVAYFTLVLKGDLSKLQNKAATKVTRSLKDVLHSTDPLQGSSQGGGLPEKATGVDKAVFKSALSAFRRESNS